eukprot:4591642-Ditylum_brightwellii.AAC.1
MARQHVLLRIVQAIKQQKHHHNVSRSRMISSVVSSSSILSSPLRSTVPIALDKGVDNLCVTIPNISQQWQSSSHFSTAATTTASTSNNKDESKNSSDNNDKKKKSKADEPNLFLDNLGKIFLAAIATVVLMLVRSSHGTTNKNNIRDDVETLSALDPLEIDDLRDANTEFTLDVLDEIHKEVYSEFGETKEATYNEFISVVLRVMRRLKGDAFTIELGHLMDRVVIAAMEVQYSNSGNDEKGIMMKEEQGMVDEKTPLSLLLTALTLALNSTVRDRVSILYQIMKQQDNTNDIDSSNSKGVVSEKMIIQMIDHLQKTCQLVPDSQIIESNVSYPVREYKIGTAKELYFKARNGDDGGKKSKEGTVPYKDEEHKMVEEDEFYALLRTRWICAWGECYVKKKRGASDETIS